MNTTQVLREYFKTGHFEAALDEMGPDAATRLSSVERGQAMGFNLIVEQDPIAQLQDSMEELSFQFEEKQMKSISERKLGEKEIRQKAYLDAIRAWQKILPDMPGNSFMEHMLRLLRNQSLHQITARELLRRLYEGSSDPSHEYAMLEILEKAIQEEASSEAQRAERHEQLENHEKVLREETSDTNRQSASGSNATKSAEQTAMLKLLQDARKILDKEHGAEVRAGLNIAEQINSMAKSPEEMQSLRNLYRSQILGFDTPQNCFNSLLQTRGQSRLADSLDFLLKSCGIDLQSPSPSQSREELQRILTDLQCVNVLRTILEKSDQLAGKMQSQFGEHCLLNGEQITGKIIDFTEMPFVSTTNISSLISSCGIAALLAQLYFCTELIGMFRLLSPRLFSDNADRFRLIDAGQEHLDGLVSLQEESEEKQREKEKGK